MSPRLSYEKTKKVVYDGITFDSMLECAYYKDLRLLEMTGHVTDIKDHIPYELNDKNGVKLGTYELDFSFKEVATSRTVAVEVKGKWKDLAWWKWKHFRSQYKADFDVIYVYPEKNKSPGEWKRKKK